MLAFNLTTKTEASLLIACTYRMARTFGLTYEKCLTNVYIAVLNVKALKEVTIGLWQLVRLVLHKFHRPQMLFMKYFFISDCRKDLWRRNQKPHSSVHQQECGKLQGEP